MTLSKSIFFIFFFLIGYACAEPLATDSSNITIPIGSDVETVIQETGGGSSGSSGGWICGEWSECKDNVTTRLCHKPNNLQINFTGKSSCIDTIEKSNNSAEQVNVSIDEEEKNNVNVSIVEEEKINNSGKLEETPKYINIGWLILFFALMLIIMAELYFYNKQKKKKKKIKKKKDKEEVVE